MMNEILISRQRMGCCEDKQIQNQSEFQRIVTPSTIVRAFPHELKQNNANPTAANIFEQSTVQAQLQNISSHSNRISTQTSTNSGEFNQAYPKREDISPSLKKSGNPIQSQIFGERPPSSNLGYPKQLNYGSLWTIQQQNSSLNNTIMISNKFGPNSGIISEYHKSSINRSTG